MQGVVIAMQGVVIHKELYVYESSPMELVGNLVAHEDLEHF